MADSQRTKVDKLVLHHAVSPQWQNKSKAELAQWFSDNGFARAYGSNAANWSGLINPYTGQRSYSQAHLAGQIVDASTPDATDAERRAGYRLVPLIADIWGQIAWHAGNWAVNQSSIGIENLGDYRNYPLSDNAQRVIADFWRPRDQALGGATAVYGHQEVTDTSTACPARIMEARNQIVAYINNAPATSPPVVTPPAAEPIDNVLNVGSYFKFDGIFSVDDMQLVGGTWQVRTNKLCSTGFTWEDNGIPVDPLVEVDGKGYATADQELSTGSLYVIPGKYRVLDLGQHAGMWLAQIEMAGVKLWVDIAPVTEVSTSDAGTATPGQAPVVTPPVVTPPVVTPPVVEPPVVTPPVEPPFEDEPPVEPPVEEPTEPEQPSEPEEPTKPEEPATPKPFDVKALIALVVAAIAAVISAIGAWFN